MDKLNTRLLAIVAVTLLAGEAYRAAAANSTILLNITNHRGVGLVELQVLIPLSQVALDVVCRRS
jgi:hypothetical protein